MTSSESPGVVLSRFRAGPESASLLSSGCDSLAAGIFRDCGLEGIALLLEGLWEFTADDAAEVVGVATSIGHGRISGGKERSLKGCMEFMAK